MTDQLYINDQGDLEEQPLTWDGEPTAIGAEGSLERRPNRLRGSKPHSQATVSERLFATEAFEQQPGQLAMAEGDHETL